MKKSFVFIRLCLLLTLIMVCACMIFSASAEDETKPSVIISTPNDGDTNVELNESVTVYFDQNIDFSTAAAGNITVNSATECIAGIVTDSAEPMKLTINLKNMSYLNLYKVTLKNIKGVNGVVMDEKTITFVTRDADGTITLSRDMETDNDKPNGKTGMLNDYTDGNYFSTTYYKSGSRSLKLNFSAAWAKAGWYDGGIAQLGKTMEVSFWGKVDSTASLTEIQLGVNGIGIIGTLSGLVPGNDFVKCSFLYTMPADASTDCLVYFCVPGSGIVYIDDFKVALANDTKILPNSYPEENGLNVPVNSKIRLAFSYNIDPISATADTIKLNGGDIAISQITVNNNVVEITPTQKFDYNNKYVLSCSLIDTGGRTVSIPSRIFTTMMQCSVGSLEIYKDYGTDGAVLLNGNHLQSGVVTAVAKQIDNISDTDGNVALVILMFKDTQMTGAEFKEIAVPAGTALTDSPAVTINVPSLTDGDYYVKAYVLDGLETLQIIGKQKITE